MTRVNALVRVLRAKNLDAVVFIDKPNIFFFSGTEYADALIVPSNGEKPILLVTYGFGDFEAHKEARGCAIRVYRPVYRAGAYRFKKTVDRVLEVLRELKLEKSRIAVCKELVNQTFYEELSKKTGLEIVDLTEDVYRLRMVKTADEIEKIKEAVRIAEEALDSVLSNLREGVTEAKLAAEAYYVVWRKGARPAFDFIVAAGRNSASAHHQPGDYKVKRGDLVVIDLGARWKGYCSDITRTVCLGKPSSSQLEIYEAVVEAQKKAISVLKGGVEASFVDKEARKVIEERGYGDCFTHSTGHGIGVEVHEPPRLSVVNKEVKIPPGTVVTVEPGIYHPNIGGVRVEDDVLVAKDGAVVLSRYPRKLVLS